MLARHFVRPVLAAVTGGMLLNGCGSLSQGFGYTGVGIPTPVQIAAFYKETEDGRIVTGTGHLLTVGEYLLTSITYTNEKCHAFFEVLESFRQDSSFIDQVLTAAIASGSPILALTESAKTVARVTSAVSVAAMLNKYTADIYAFATYKDPLKRHVFDALNDYQTQKGLGVLAQLRYGAFSPSSSGNGFVDVPLNSRTIKINKKRALAFLNSDLPIDLIIARTIAADYAAICSLANMRRIVT